MGGAWRGFPPSTRSQPRRGTRLTMVATASLARGSSVFRSTDLSNSGYLVRRWCGLASMSLSFSRWHCSCFSAHCDEGRRSGWTPAARPTQGATPTRLHAPHRDVGAEEVVVPQQAAHVLHAALLLHAVANVGLKEGAELAGVGAQRLLVTACACGHPGTGTQACTNATGAGRARAWRGSGSWPLGGRVGSPGTRAREPQPHSAPRVPS